MAITRNNALLVGRSSSFGTLHANPPPRQLSSTVKVTTWALMFSEAHRERQREHNRWVLRELEAGAAISHRDGRCGTSAF